MPTNILIVEDDPTLRPLLSKLLSAAGYTPTEADCLAALRARFEGPAPDLLLLDLVLPDGDGLSALPEVKKRWPTTRVVILTGHGSVEAAEGAYGIEDVFMLSKPMDSGMLESVIELALAKPRPKVP